MPVGTPIQPAAKPELFVASPLKNAYVEPTTLCPSRDAAARMTTAAPSARRRALLFTAAYAFRPRSCQIS